MPDCTHLGPGGRNCRLRSPQAHRVMAQRTGTDVDVMHQSDDGLVWSSEFTFVPGAIQHGNHPANLDPAEERKAKYNAAKVSIPLWLLEDLMSAASAGYDWATGSDAATFKETLDMVDPLIERRKKRIGWKK